LGLIGMDWDSTGQERIGKGRRRWPWPAQGLGEECVKRERAPGTETQIGGLGGWLLERLRGQRTTQPRLALVERIALAPRQSLALVEAEGRRILVATSAEGGPAFYALDEKERPAAHLASRRAPKFASSRVSW
jgi:hypothetical protein